MIKKIYIKIVEPFFLKRKLINKITVICFAIKYASNSLYMCLCVCECVYVCIHLRKNVITVWKYF